MFSTVLLAQRKQQPSVSDMSHLLQIRLLGKELTYEYASAQASLEGQIATSPLRPSLDNGFPNKRNRGYTDAPNSVTFGGWKRMLRYEVTHTKCSDPWSQRSAYATDEKPVTAR